MKKVSLKKNPLNTFCEKFLRSMEASVQSTLLLKLENNSNLEKKRKTSKKLQNF